MTRSPQLRSDRSRRWQRDVGILLCVLMALLGGNALLRETGMAMDRPQSGEGSPPSQWKLGMPAVEPLRSSLKEVRGLVPEGALVAVHAPHLAPPELFFLSMWCSYYLPQHKVLRLVVIQESHRSPTGSYVLVWPPTASVPDNGEEIYSDELVSLRRLPTESKPTGAVR